MHQSPECCELEAYTQGIFNKCTFRSYFSYCLFYIFFFYIYNFFLFIICTLFIFILKKDRNFLKNPHSKYFYV